MGWFKDIRLIPDPDPNAPIKRCGPCQRERGEDVDMEAGREWLPGRVAEVWQCPECGTTVLRNDSEEWV